MQRWDDGSGRITVVRSKTDAGAQGATVAITLAAMSALSAIRPAGVASDAKVFGLSESQVAVKRTAVAVDDQRHHVAQFAAAIDMRVAFASFFTCIAVRETFQNGFLQLHVLIWWGVVLC